MKKAIIKIAVKKSIQLMHKHPQFKHYIHFSFLVQNGRILSIGRNHVGIPPKHLGYHTRINDIPKTHAELDAYKKAKRILNHSEPFECINIRLNKSAELRISKPCHCCYAFLKQLGCKKFYYSCSNSLIDIEI